MAVKTDKRLLFISQEIAPYVPGGEVAAYGREIAQSMQERGFEVRTFMPKYGTVNERRNQLHEVIRLSGLNITINDADHPLIIKVASLQPSRIQVYFIDNDDYFQRLDDDADVIGSNRADNDERVIFFARGAMETVKKLRWDPLVIDCSGWMTALCPIYLRKLMADDPAFKKTKIVYTVLPGELTGGLDPQILTKLKADGISDRQLKPFRDMLKTQTPNTDFLRKMAIQFADAIIINSPEVSPDVMEAIEARKVPVLSYEEAAKGMDVFSEFFNSLINK